MDKHITAKIARLRNGETPRSLDLFAGCGGISLGASLAGCKVIGAVEIDPPAALSHAINFHGDLEEGQFKAHSVARDITQLDPAKFLTELVPGCRSAANEVDVLMGGPPCQAFARIGRAKLREVAEHPEAFLHDERSGLYMHYIRFVEALKPVAVIVENVPDVLNYGGINVFETMAAGLAKLGYECRYTLLNSVHYGVAQMRTRCFMIGIHRSLDLEPSLPAPTRFHQLPQGYRGTAGVALKNLDLFGSGHYVETSMPTKEMLKAVTAHEALGDLPSITEHLEGKLKRGAQRFDRPDPCPVPDSISHYGSFMRTWPGFENTGFVSDHVIRYLPRDYKIFAQMKAGDQYPEAHQLAMRMFGKAVERWERKNKKKLTPEDEAHQELLAEYVPPYAPDKFPNKWRKMWRDEPARTIMAHIGKDSYSHIHYDSKQARTISVREAARLHSFPDGFRFAGTMNPAFRQIGNAVPPLMAYAVVGRLLEDLGAKTFVREYELCRNLRTLKEAGA